MFVHHNKGRPTNEEKRKRLECPEIVEEEMKNIQISLCLKKDNKLLVMVSIAMDDMIRLVVMHPAIWFMDCTGGTSHN